MKRKIRSDKCPEVGKEIATIQMRQVLLVISVRLAVLTESCSIIQVLLPSVITHNTLSPQGSQEALCKMAESHCRSLPSSSSAWVPGVPGVPWGWLCDQGGRALPIYGTWVHILHHILQGVHDLPDAKSGV